MVRAKKGLLVAVAKRGASMCVSREIESKSQGSHGIRKASMGGRPVRSEEASHIDTSVVVQRNEEREEVIS